MHDKMDDAELMIDGYNLFIDAIGREVGQQEEEEEYCYILEINYRQLRLISAVISLSRHGVKLKLMRDVGRNMLVEQCA